MSSIEELRNISKWTDDIKKDTRYFGLGYVNNQTHFQNGAKKDHPFEDRYFSYELKENEVYAYGVLDGFNGTWTVDLLEQLFISNIYFEHLGKLKDMQADEVYSLLEEEFKNAEQTLEENLKYLLIHRSDLSQVNDRNCQRGTYDYMENRKEIENIDSQINSGAFGIISLIVNDRLFIANVGPSHCFLCFYDQKSLEKKVIMLETQHNLSNIDELNRLSKLNADIDSIQDFPVNFTRCLGNFKLKQYYIEYRHFENCKEQPITCVPDHPVGEIKIDDSFLFMAMYSDGFAKALEKSGICNTADHVSPILARMLIPKIISEQTLNSAAQSVLDEVKRAFDDKFAGQYGEREDFTLGVRIFDSNIRAKLRHLEGLEQRHHMNHSASHGSAISTREITFVENDDEFDDNDDDDSLNNTVSSGLSSQLAGLPLDSVNKSKPQQAASGSDGKLKRSEKPISELVDENDRVKPYVNFDELVQAINSTAENKSIIDDFVRQLEEMGRGDETSSSENNSLEQEIRL